MWLQCVASRDCERKVWIQRHSSMWYYRLVSTFLFRLHTFWFMSIEIDSERSNKNNHQFNPKICKMILNRTSENDKKKKLHKNIDRNECVDDESTRATQLTALKSVIRILRLYCDRIEMLRAIPMWGSLIKTKNDHSRMHFTCTGSIETHNKMLVARTGWNGLWLFLDCCLLSPMTGCRLEFR